MSTKTITDQDYVDKWREFLNIIKNISKEPQTTRKKKFEDLIKTASSNNRLTMRQKEGIIDRCNYQIWLISNPRKQKANTIDIEHIQSTRIKKTSVSDSKK